VPQVRYRENPQCGLPREIDGELHTNNAGAVAHWALRLHGGWDITGVALAQARGTTCRPTKEYFSHEF
jgi:hypothetical protein